MKNMVFSFLPAQGTAVLLGLVVHSPKPPNDEEWNAYFTAVRQRENELPKIRTLVLTEGGGPNSAQRKVINDFLGGRQTPVVLVSSSAMIRGVTTALSWFNPLVKSCSPEQIDAAFDYLGVPEEDQERVWKEIRKL